MSKTLNKLQSTLDTQVNNHIQGEGSKTIVGTEHDYGDIHIIFGKIFGIAIVRDIDGYFDYKTQSQVINSEHYYMFFLSEDDDYWYINENIHYADFSWINDYAEVFQRAIEYKSKLNNGKE